MPTSKNVVPLDLKYFQFLGALDMFHISSETVTSAINQLLQKSYAVDFLGGVFCKFDDQRFALVANVFLRPIYSQFVP